MVVESPATKSAASWKEYLLGKFARAVVVVSGPAEPESWKFPYGNTLAASEAFDTSDVSLFLPFDNQRVTEDGGADSVTWTLRGRPGSKPVLIISGSGTLKVEGVVDAIACGIEVKPVGAAAQAATALAAGTYFIEA